jgi:hypothetical protein
MLSDGERSAAEMAILGVALLCSYRAMPTAIAGIICRSDASRSSFIEHCYQEALAIIEENKPVVLAVAQALIDHPERTLNAAEIDAMIAQTLARQPLAAEEGRRAAWRQVTERVAEITQ